MPVPADLLRRVVPRDGGLAFPASWPEEARSKILAGMASSAAQRGFSKTKVDDVLTAAHASRRTFYLHFDDREQCLLATFDAIRADTLLALSEADGDLEGAVRGLLRYFAAWPAHAQVLTSEVIAVGPAGLIRHADAMALLATRLRECGLVPSETAGRLTVEELAQARIALLYRLVQQRISAGQHASLPALAGDVAQVVRQPLRA